MDHLDHRRQISTLLAWCALNGLEIDSRLKLDWDPKTGIAVYSKGSNIPPNTKLVRIPRHAVLSTKSCTLSEHMSSTPYGLGAQLALSLALYAEILKGKFSRWFGYLQSLPYTDVDIPVFWDLEMEIGPGSRRLEDGREALKWLRGTEVWKILQKRSENNRNLIEELNDYYHETAETLILRHRDKILSQFPVTPTLHGFHRAYALVSSRAFIVDAYHGLCMVPIADAFNHESPNHVHLESDYYVCPECGSLHECVHDWDNPPTVLGIDSINTAHKAVAIADDELESDLFMVSVTAVPSGVEVFNTYGETLTNAQLLTQYGFILEANDNDTLTWDIYQLLHDHASGGEQRSVVDIGALWKQLCPSDWSIVSRSGLVYFANADMNVITSPLTLNGDGKISHQMWLIVSLHALHRVGKSFRNETVPTLSRLRNLLSTQMILEVHLERDETEGQVAGPIDSYDFDTKLLKELEELCQLMIHLCADRKAKTAFSGTIPEVGEYFDTLSHEKPRTRMAVSLVLNELSLLDSCQIMWTGLLGMVRRVGEWVP
ncbi:hypothetical protein JOM56_002667 [Amanita muscaria]